MRVPRKMPPPKRRIVPQSMSTASFQLSVNRRSFQVSGRTKSSAAARIATTPSSAWSLKRPGRDALPDGCHALPRTVIPARARG
jgi:hypothetical protein